MKKTLLLLALAACSKTDPKPDPATTTTPTSSSDVPTFHITGTPQTSATVATTAIAPSMATTTASQGAPTLAVTTAPVASEKTAVVPDAGKKEKELAPTTAAAARMSGKNFALDLASPGCRNGESCQMTIRITAGDGYHVNKEYPYKFLPKDTANVEYASKQFSKDSGDFKIEGEKNGTLTVRFKPTASGKAKVTGTYKMSVCSDENCQIEQPTIDFDVNVL